MKRGEAGFSLIESLVALLILAFSLAVLYEAAIGATRNIRVAQEYSEAQILAESALSECLLIDADTDQIAGEFGRFQWQCSAIPLAGEGQRGSAQAAPGLDLAEFVVTVTWSGGAKNRSVVIRTFSKREMTAT